MILDLCTYEEGKAEGVEGEPMEPEVRCDLCGEEALSLSECDQCGSELCGVCAIDHHLECSDEGGPDEDH